MVKITPDPPHTNDEEALTAACEILQSAIATAYESADNLDGSRRKLALAVMHLIDMAHTLVESVLEKKSCLDDISA